MTLSKLNPGNNLSREFLEVVEQSAIAAARTMGVGDRNLSDQAAVEVMREVMDNVSMKGTVVIGEGERDKAPMLYIGEEVGKGEEIGQTVPEVDIAVDPLEGTNLCAMGAAGAITVLASSEKGGLLNAPDCYMEKIIVGPSAKGAIDIEASVEDNLSAIAKRLDREVENLVVVVLDRPRHARLIQDIRAAGARIRLISDGDLSAGISVALRGTGVHVVMGIGGAPEGVITAAALKCLNGEILAKLVIKDEDQAQRMRNMGIRDLNKAYSTNDLASGSKIIFAATGVTDGTLLKGVRIERDGVRTQSLLMNLDNRHVRFVETIHLADRADVTLRL
ncbi:MAG: class II fructose-bisphosphatase [Acidobacteriia bacterium]|jgi:fructose-1,6-bisphosphatase class II|nr:class II fructose-bisphosphatase [Terriglobia bacterium]